jgi:hypothetical protein
VILRMDTGFHLRCSRFPVGSEGAQNLASLMCARKV